MMKEEKLFEKPGDSLQNFFGVPAMKVVGVLEPTGTILDRYHVVSRETLGNLATVAEVQATTADGEPKLFYVLSAVNVPSKLTGSIPSSGLNAITIGGKRYQPIYIGADEAATMEKEKIFGKEGDLIPNLFGNDVIVAGVLPKTSTALDNLHFVVPDFQVKAEKQTALAEGADGN